MINSKKRRFILGDDWIYFKIYSGPKTLESILINEILKGLEELIHQQIIDKFFYVRYADPDYHLRLRFHLLDIAKLHLVIQLINQNLSAFVDNKLVWKISADTYCRELERYGSATIEDMETLFYFDSMAIVNYLNETECLGNDKFRWFWGIKCMDEIMDSFNLSLNEKLDLYSKLNYGYSKEFKMNKSLKLQLDKKYRREIGQIRQVMEGRDGIIGIQHILNYKKKSISIIDSILNNMKNNNVEITLTNLLGSLVHMHFNRLFRTKQRMHEMVIYYFMCKFHKSQVAKIKYNPLHSINV